MSCEIRLLTPDDLEIVSPIYADYVGEPPTPSWRARVTRLLEPDRDGAVALVADGYSAGGTAYMPVLGYIVGEVRRWEFGSPPAGWIFGIGVRRAQQRRGVGRELLDRAIAQFRSCGVETVRTMVRHDEVRVLRFFRSAGFVGGTYTELELGLGTDDARTAGVPGASKKKESLIYEMGAANGRE